MKKEKWASIFQICTDLQVAIAIVSKSNEILSYNDTTQKLLFRPVNQIKTILKQFHSMPGEAEKHEMKVQGQPYIVYRNQLIGNDEEYYLLFYPADKRLEFIDEIEQQLEQLVNTRFEGTVIHDLGKVIDIDERTAELFGYSRKELIHLSIFELIAPEEWTKVQEAILKNIQVPFELKGLHKNGSTIHVEVRGRPYPYRKKEVRLVAVRDITKRKQQEEQITYLAFHDEVTGLMNRRAFQIKVKDYLHAPRLPGHTVVVATIGLNRLKTVNDALGIEAGNRLVKAVSEFLRAKCSSGVEIARLDGDEFILLASMKDDLQEIEGAIEEILFYFNEPIQLDEFYFHVHLCAGISVASKSTKDVNELIRQAEVALHAIKDLTHGSTQFYEKEMSTGSIREMIIENELRHALAKEEFSLVFHPQACLDSGRLSGVEALLRWKSSALGQVSPYEFIGVAERTGLIIPIGKWVIEQSCLAAANLRRQLDRPVRMGVNLSPVQFVQPNLVEVVTKALEEADLEPGLLELEITESVAMEDEKQVMEKLIALRELGVTVSIDDFGTGYSSLQYLSQYPIDKLKIDQSFLRIQTKTNQTIIKSIVSMGHNMGMKVIAEGVETYDDVALLQSLQCDEMQGFVWTKPLPYVELIEKLQEAEIFPLELVKVD
ncbi:putative bifunctional diguanylate cyclase/phosphodiesterase [Bacillus sp. FJAT-45037]|uniref:putative bifunctional diguanylate cyclase/phosphodiesterase n=1 Tax=Bacillus sp. FJAT-45037 TaxID=2011007 RepID=UPI000C23BBFC|nr:GGDEF domain-containing phosphodiesterase [Bacillus sp. FJAT-45037]